ncbi:RNA polymerase sigma factor [Actimicrobium antarcticum]|uniref:RNA polymerase sigma factor HrpL n=1 Tax=Actimicrobium antarcticum TaxID=1051899 RepID=A0ABP7SUU0_9BURK
MTSLLEQEHTSTEQSAYVHTSPLSLVDIDLLFKQHYSHLIRFVQRYVRNIEDARDVVQNTFVESVRCADRFSGASKPSTWLFGIALNLARNHVRRNYAAASKHADESLIDDMVDMSGNPADVIENQQLAERVEQMLSTLPDRIRETFEAVLEHESSYAVAAEKMHIPIGTVRSRVSRVRDQIRMIID